MVESLHHKSYHKSYHNYYPKAIATFQSHYHHCYRNLGRTICEVDPIEELIWSKVCITKAITKAITIATRKLSPPFNRTITIAITT